MRSGNVAGTIAIGWIILRVVLEPSEPAATAMLAAWVGFLAGWVVGVAFDK